GIDTTFSGGARFAESLDQQQATVQAVKSIVAERGVRVVVLPENAGGLWTPTVEHLWKSALRGTGSAVVLGASIVRPAGYDNVLVEINPEASHVAYVERMPVPVSMWQPWQALAGGSPGVEARFFDNPVVMIAGRRVAPLICYEQLLVWPILQSMALAPDLIVAGGNGWWAKETTIVAIQIAATKSWAALFGLPLVSAVNR
ncbi:MAG: nitrilase-related carbon-nitrogen hydrolase, partial [Bradyrhizobium sp.]|nr:nitrilase-related carbon-nitrogen hydrolase [Bradyrhizobium sp.]